MEHLSQRVDEIHEAGFLFESWVFGAQLGVTGVTDKATQYGWNF